MFFDNYFAFWKISLKTASTSLRTSSRVEITIIAKEMAEFKSREIFCKKIDKLGVWVKSFSQINIETINLLFSTAAKYAAVVEEDM